MSKAFYDFYDAMAVSHAPVQLFVNQSTFYNDNFYLLSPGQTLPNNLSRGDLYSTTTVGASANGQAGAQNYFADVSYANTVYRHNSQLDTNLYSADAGVHWNLGTHCFGDATGATARRTVPIEEVAGVYTVETVRTESLNGFANCHLLGYLSAIGKAGWKQTDYSVAPVNLNNNTATYGTAGLEYAVPNLETLRGQVTYSNRNYGNRSAATTPGLATEINETDYELFYSRVISPYLQFNGSLGWIQMMSVGSGTTMSGTVYNAALTWKPTAKLSFTVADSHTISPMANLVADFVETDTRSVGVGYSFSPRLSFNASYSRSEVHNSTLSGVGETPVLQSYRALVTSFGASYLVGPYLNATANYRHLERIDQVLDITGTSNLYLLGLNYKH